MEPFFIQTLTEEHALQLHALYQGEWWSHGRTLAEVHRLLAGDSRLFALCNGAGGPLLAFARVLTDGVFKAFIFDVIVHPDHRGKGLGRNLMYRILEDSVISQVRHIELYCRTDRISYYRELGFTDEAQKDVVLMRRMRPAAGLSSPPLAHPPPPP
ncbi:MAG TPA: GNAT family N-acetyltransferase [Verrucomicrobiales bacterium]|nr:GNAT family N-acetyltransferase [Verrucomicrobiales bacterium]